VPLINFNTSTYSTVLPSDFTNVIITSNISNTISTYYAEYHNQQRAYNELAFFKRVIPSTTILGTPVGSILINQSVGTASTTTNQAIYNTSNIISTNFYYTDGTPELTLDQISYQVKQDAERAIKRAAAVHRAKGSIKRALKLMDNVGFGNDIRVFLGGDSVEVSHPDSLFKFLLTKSKYIGLIDKTISPGFSTPYSLQLYTKTDVHVANLCVYLENTPVLDQILAVSMYIKSGDEESILKTANWSSICNDEEICHELIEVYPALESKLGYKLKRHNDVITYTDDVVCPIYV
jgi:hypothetical protein